MNNKLELTPARAELLLNAIDTTISGIYDEMHCVEETRDNLYDNIICEWAAEAVFDRATARLTNYKTQVAELDFMRKFLVQYLTDNMREEANGKN